MPCSRARPPRLRPRRSIAPAPASRLSIALLGAVMAIAPIASTTARLPSTGRCASTRSSHDRPHQRKLDAAVLAYVSGYHRGGEKVKVEKDTSSLSETTQEPPKAT